MPEIQIQYVDREVAVVETRLDVHTVTNEVAVVTDKVYEVPVERIV